MQLTVIIYSFVVAVMATVGTERQMFCGTTPCIIEILLAIKFRVRHFVP